jgi:hypothetical protein
LSIHVGTGSPEVEVSLNGQPPTRTDRRDEGFIGVEWQQEPLREVPAIEIAGRLGSDAVVPAALKLRVTRAESVGGENASGASAERTPGPTSGNRVLASRS